jgi:membrane protease YdiL (CAAX protease family)
LRALDQSAKEANEPLTPAQEDAYQLLLKLYQVRDAGQAEADLTDEEEARLRERLGWFGDLALAPPDGSHQAARDVALQPAYRTLTGLITFGSVFGVLALIGLFGLPIFLICLATGSARTRLTTGSPASGLYAEAFALYLLLFVGASFAITYLRPPGGDLLWSGAAALLGLTAIAWPVVRGLPWSQVRRDIGINGGRHPVLELLLGLVGYALTLPLLAVGFIITLILLTLQRHLAGEAKPGQGPTHPVNDYLAAGDWQVGLQVLILAAVIAPIVEETLFRGVLHRQLREATGRLGGVLSFLVSAFFGSFLFAVIHPQGFLFVPALMGLALGFALLREWRDSVIPGVIAHGVHNGSLVLFLLVVAS